MAASTVRRSARVPARCPAATGSPRRLAQRPFPSMMIATERAISGNSCSSSGRRPRSDLIRVRMRTLRLEDDSDLQNLRFLALEQLVDLLDVPVRHLLDALLGPVLFVR